MITAKIDDRRRVRIPDARPGQIFEIVAEGNGYRLALVKSCRPKRSILEDLKPLTKAETEAAFGPNKEFDALEHHCASLPAPAVPGDE